jgi:hypothetical protein
MGEACPGTRNQSYKGSKGTIEPYEKKGYERISAGVGVVTMLMINLKTGTNDIFNCREKNIILCKDSAGPGRRVCLGFDRVSGLLISYYSDDAQDSIMGSGLCWSFWT